MKDILRFIFVVLIGFHFWSCKSNNSNTNPDSTIDTFPVVTLHQQQVDIYQDYPGTVQGIENVEIRPKIDGFIKNIYVDEGASVHKNQLLFEIDAPQYEQLVRTAKANIKIAMAEVDAARMTIQKVKPMVDEKVVSQYELKSSQYTLEAKQAALAEAKANYQNAVTNLSYTKIYSPVNGVIGLIPFKIGSLVNSTTTQPLTTVSNNSNIYVYFSFNEKQALDFFAATKGRTLQEKLKTLPPVSLVLPNGTVFDQQGRIYTASGLINTQTGSVNLRATFPNPAGLIRSGNSALVRIPQIKTWALLIPQKSVYQIQNKIFVYKLGANNKVSSVGVTVTPSSYGQYYVVETGLQEGDKIVSDGIDKLKEEMQIFPQNISLQQSVGK